jgi:hypothetical protein
MVDLSSSSDEEGLIADVSWDEEFAKRLFGDLNYDVLGPPSDDKILILIDSDKEKEEEEREEKTTSTEDAATSAAVTSAIVNPTSIASTDADDVPTGVKMIIVMIAPAIRRLTATAAAEMTLGCLRLPHQEGA